MKSRLVLGIAALALGISVSALVLSTHRHTEAAPIVTIWPSLTKVPYGATVKLHWLSYNAATCQMEQANTATGIQVPLNGTYVVGPLKHLTVMRVVCDSKTKWFADGTGESQEDHDVSVIDVAPLTD